MRILMLTHNRAGIGGNYMRAVSLAAPLAEMGHAVTLLASRYAPGFGTLTEEHRGIRVKQVGDVFPERVRHGGLSPLDVAGRLALVMRSDFDVIHGFDHRFSVSIPALVKRRWGGIPYVADWADLWGWEGIAGERRGLSGRALGWADHVWERETHRRADAVTAISSDLAARARTLGVASERIRLVQVGANVDQIRPLPKDAMRIKHGLSPGVPIVVSIGFAPYDAALLAETFAVLAHQDRDVLLILTGGEMADVKVVAAAAGVLDRVRHLGCVPYEMLGEVLACGDVMLLPYSNRSLNAARYPNRFGDYLAAGRPIATNPTGDLGPVIAAEQIGVTAEDHPEAFAAAILALLRDPARCEIMGRCARNLAETRFSWRTIASPLEVLYQELIAEKSKAHSDSGR